MTNTTKVVAGATGAAVVAGALLYLTAPGPLPPLRVDVTRAAPEAVYRICWDSMANAVYKSEVRSAYPNPKGWGDEVSPSEWDIVQARIDCPSYPCCIDRHEWRPDPTTWALYIVAGSYTADLTPVMYAPVAVDLGFVGSYPIPTTTTTVTTSSTTITTSTTAASVTTTTVGGCL